MKKQCRWYIVCPIRRYVEKGLLDKKWVNEYCLGDFTKCVRKKMEESGEDHPDYMLPNGDLMPELLEKNGSV
ncbi:MAG: uracil-DNA glycosylase [Candidatus Helarchaeota archaeon]